MESLYFKNIVFDGIQVGKINYYKSNDGKFCFIKYFGTKLIVNLPVSIITFDVDFSYTKPNVFIYLNDNKLIEFNNNIKELIVKHVFDNSVDIYGHQKTMESLSEFYSNPHKVSKTKNSFSDLLKLKLKCQVNENLPKRTKVKLSVEISGIWFSQSSFGPYYDIVDLEVVTDSQKKCLIVQDNSDSDVENYLKK